MTRIGIVCGYGTKLDDRTKHFLDGTAVQIKKLQPDAVILSGGQSDPGNSLTEADFMHRFFSGKIDHVEFLLEKEALTTLHNLFNCHELLNHKRILPDEIYIFCDRIRSLKVKILSRIIFKGLYVRVVPVKRKESLTVYLLQLPSLLYQVLGALIPGIRRWLENEKRKYVDRKR